MADEPLQRIKKLPENFWEMSDDEKRSWARRFLLDLSPNAEKRIRKAGSDSDL
jgi:hypothetical protein